MVIMGGTQDPMATNGLMSHSIFQRLAEIIAKHTTDPKRHCGQFKLNECNARNIDIKISGQQGVGNACPAVYSRM